MKYEIRQAISFRPENSFILINLRTSLNGEILKKKKTFIHGQAILSTETKKNCDNYKKTLNVVKIIVCITSLYVRKR